MGKTKNTTLKRPLDLTPDIVDDNAGSDTF